MKKSHKIIYWIATVWLALGMTSTGIVQLLGVEEGVKAVVDMGFPGYFVTLLGLWKMLGVIAVLIPRTPLIKEWAYAGFFFVMTGALFSHVAFGHPFSEVLPSLLLLVLTGLSWYFRPPSRRLLPLNWLQSKSA